MGFFKLIGTYAHGIFHCFWPKICHMGLARSRGHRAEKVGHVDMDTDAGVGVGVGMGMGMVVGICMGVGVGVGVGCCGGRKVGVDECS